MGEVTPPRPFVWSRIHEPGLVTTIRPGDGAGIGVSMAIELPELRKMVAGMPIAGMAPVPTFVR